MSFPIHVFGPGLVFYESWTNQMNRMNTTNTQINICLIHTFIIFGIEIGQIGQAKLSDL